LIQEKVVISMNTIMGMMTMDTNVRTINIIQMKKIIIILTIFLGIQVNHLYAQCGGTVSNNPQPTSIGIVVSSNDVETVWNVFRLANYSKNQGDTVQVFLLGKGVELDSLVKKNSDLKEQTDQFLQNGGIILGCGTCLSRRNINEPQVCKFSLMADLYDLIRKNKIVLTF